MAGAATYPSSPIAGFGLYLGCCFFNLKLVIDTKKNISDP